MITTQDLDHAHEQHSGTTLTYHTHIPHLKAKPTGHTQTHTHTHPWTHLWAPLIDLTFPHTSYWIQMVLFPLEVQQQSAFLQVFADVVESVQGSCRNVRFGPSVPCLHLLFILQPSEMK